MKKLSAMFTGLALAAMLTPAISMAQEAQPDSTPAPQEQQVKAIVAGVPVQACTTDGFSDKAVLGLIVPESEVTAAGGVEAVFTEDFKKAAVQELADAWTAVIGSMTAEQIGTEGPSAEFQASVKSHLKTVQDDLSKKAHVHFLVAPLQLAAPTEGCAAPAPQQ